MESLATEKGLGLKLDIMPNLPAGRGDERRIAQVLLNLLGNAIKFTDRGEVAISARTLSGSFNVAVRDTGPGIPLSEQVKIFEEFHQADNSTTKNKGGSGLGLAIAKRIIEMHGGRIWVESSPGAGSTFSVSLPVRASGQMEPTGALTGSPELLGHQAVGAAGFEGRAYGEPKRPNVAARMPAASARRPANSGSKTPPGA